MNERLPGLDLTLPSEAQWEYACRAGTTTPFSFGANITPEQVNYNGNYPYAGGEKGRYRQQTVPVASLPPNRWGLYEMHGNVWEWTSTRWGGTNWEKPGFGYPYLVDDGREDLQVDDSRVLRGGAWQNPAALVRCACRFRNYPIFRNDLRGFRVVSPGF